MLPQCQLVFLNPCGICSLLLFTEVSPWRKRRRLKTVQQSGQSKKKGTLKGKRNVSEIYTIHTHTHAKTKIFMPVKDRKVACYKDIHINRGRMNKRMNDPVLYLYPFSPSVWSYLNKHPET